MITSEEINLLGLNTDGKPSEFPVEHDPFTKTFKVGETCISYKFYGGTIRRDIRDNFKILLATGIHKESGLIFKIVEDGSFYGSEQMMIWVEDQVISDLSNMGVEPCL